MPPEYAYEPYALGLNFIECLEPEESGCSNLELALETSGADCDSDPSMSWLDGSSANDSDVGRDALSDSSGSAATECKQMATEEAEGGGG